MPTPREVLVTTTSTIEGLPVKKYLRPISAHVVTGINVFNDILGSFTDFFGGRSSTYQKQIASIYNEAIERIKLSAYEIGANGVIGLNIDVDEISGNGKSMLMITATGTAVIVDRSLPAKEKSEIAQSGLISVESLKVYREKMKLLEKARDGSLVWDNSTWDFFTVNAISEFFPYILSKYPEAVNQEHVNPQLTASFTRSVASYLEALTEEKRKELLYNALLTEDKPRVIQKLQELIKLGNLFDESHIYRLLKHPDFGISKRGVAMATTDKPFYAEQDLECIESIKKFIAQNFPERGERTTKQGFISSKQKPVWKCGCGKTNDIDTVCSGCQHDIYGFKAYEPNPVAVIGQLDQKIEAIRMHLTVNNLAI